MTLRRFVICMVAVVVISIVNIYHHALTVKCGYELSRVQNSSAELRVSIANTEGRVAMLEAPSRLRQENAHMQLSLVGPGSMRQPSPVMASREETGF